MGGMDVNREKDQRLFQWQMAAIPSGRAVMSKIPVVCYQADISMCWRAHALPCDVYFLIKEGFFLGLCDLYIYI